MTNNALEDMARNYSFWQHKYGAYTPNDPLPKGSYNADVLIVGAGYTGLTTAREVKRDHPELSVMVLDANEIGFGASGRNGGFNMTLFGMEPEVTVLRWGKEKAREAQAYMQKAVAYVHDLIENEGLDSDYEHTGMWRVAYTERQEKRLKNTYRLLCDLAKDGSYCFYEQSKVREKLNAPHIRAAIYEPETGILDPCKHVRALKRLAEQTGAEIYEHSAVTDIRRTQEGVVVHTSSATIRAKKLVLATNAWTHTLPGPRKLRSRQRAVWTYQIVSEPLTDDEWKTLGWGDRMSIEDNRQLVHYLRITKCGRITMGGGDIGFEYGNGMDKWHDENVWQDLEAHFRWLFPSLAHKKIDYKWGGAVSANFDMVPEIGFIGDQNIIYSTGCIGHGVSLTQLNGRLIADLIAGVDSELSRFWIVNRSAIPVPPGNVLSYLGVKAITGVLKGVDWFEERNLHKAYDAMTEGQSNVT
ncbi:oxidoreductase [Streptosporangium jomthongense]|uniref:NAD(P)/FAD-dependent oxidoreductase n=1 Tax=Marinobacter aromaticivorans TaxID=1494078 RepID=A0ABW2IVF8_9GAMM|nr:FAD-binding oxidoreductase [Marinobacter aromaticivorans]GGE69001.1 oxidoreductase [Streptosporangium jomthongense]